MHQPQRTCVGCQTPRPQRELLRLRRRADGRIVPDREVAGGRSIYLCPVRGCYDRAVRRQAIGRAWGRCTYDPTKLWGELTAAQERGGA